MPEKDPFGDKLRDKERADEDQYFAKRNRQLLEKMRTQAEPADETTAREISRGCCPKCGKPLDSRMADDIAFEECTGCHGIWLGRNEVARLSRRESESWLGRFFRQTLVHTR
jgi:RNase P subunit RPR2